MLLLASSSPRRRELLQLTGIPFETVPANADESIPAGMPPAQAVELLAKRKAGVVFETHPQDVVLGADTLVTIDGMILGKPNDEADAVRMLRLLSGRVHETVTGFCVRSAAGETSGVERTEVTFLPLSDADILSYVKTGEPLDKAGAYGIQGHGALLIQGIRGDYYTVMGLPIARINRILKKQP